MNDKILEETTEKLGKASEKIVKEVLEKYAEKKLETVWRPLDSDSAWCIGKTESIEEIPPTFGGHRYFAKDDSNWFPSPEAARADLARTRVFRKLLYLQGQLGAGKWALTFDAEGKWKVLATDGFVGGNFNRTPCYATQEAAQKVLDLLGDEMNHLLFKV